MIKYEFHELIMLDILIYIDFYTKENNRLGDIIKDIINNNKIQILIDKMPFCLIQRDKEEWQSILNFINNNSRLSNLVLVKIQDDNVLHAVCFKDNENNYLVVFRGTSTSNEWINNGKGAYLDETVEQKEALAFIESIDNDKLIISGHSKGGNLAQYCTILSNKVFSCLAVNSQGFSKEFVKKYKNEINKNREKIICINGKYDYVNCLLKNISSNNIFIKTEKQKNPLYYHKCEILLNDFGTLRDKTQKPFFNKIINDFSVSLLSDLPKDVQIIVFNSLMDGIKTIMCKDKLLDENLIKIAFSTIILIIYGQYFKYKESVSLFYSFIEMITVPLFVWNDFVECDETKDKIKYDKLINKIKKFEERPLIKIKNMKKNNIYVKLNQSIKKFYKDLRSVSLIS